MGYASERDFGEALAWGAHGEICPIHGRHYRSDLGPCPDCKDGVKVVDCKNCKRSINGGTCLDPEPTCLAVEENDDLDPRGFPGDD